jgi:D-arabinose 1-dehydrogenase-like Zn-dependent alcohol dehydrogenase
MSFIAPARWSTRTMRAARVSGPRAHFEVREIAIPEIDEDDALIKVGASGICRTDWHVWKGDFDWNEVPFPPSGVFGHEIGGTVEAVGSRVTSLQPGQKVTVPWNFACGRCSSCRRGFQNRCDQGSAPQLVPGSGGWAEYIRVPNADLNCVALPDGVDELTAAALGCRYMTAWRSIHAQTGVRGGETAVIVGCGGVGLAAIEIATCLGADVIGVDVDDKKLEMARTVGARAVVNSKGLSPEETGLAVRKLTSGDVGADLAVDALGIQATVNTALYSLRKGGRLGQVGLTTQAERGKVLVPLDMIVLKELQVTGSLGNPHWSYEMLLKLVGQGRLKPQRLVTRQVKLSDVESVLIEMENFHTMGYVIITDFKS